MSSIIPTSNSTVALTAAQTNLSKLFDQPVNSSSVEIALTILKKPSEPYFSSLRSIISTHLIFIPTPLIQIFIDYLPPFCPNLFNEGPTITSSLLFLAVDKCMSYNLDYFNPFPQPHETLPETQKRQAVINSTRAQELVGFVPIVKLFLDAGANPMSKVAEDQTILSYAKTKVVHTEMLSALMQASNPLVIKTNAELENSIKKFTATVEQIE